MSTQFTEKTLSNVQHFNISNVIYHILISQISYNIKIWGIVLTNH
jgi:hypothetical protein